VFIPLVDVLRCVNAHEDTWLVATIERAEERDIVTGMLGCPICFAEYPIRDGVVYFTETAPEAAYRAPTEDDAMRLAAALDLTDARMTAVLQGAWGAQAPLVRGVAPAQLLLVNPPPGMSSGDGVSIVRAEHAPIAHGSMHAVAFDETATDAMVESLRACLRAGGRMLGPVSRSVPSGLSELARDEAVWVAEPSAGEAVSRPIGLARRREG
jgi:uncharacterized protein YbaR (Trm112 family)